MLLGMRDLVGHLRQWIDVSEADGAALWPYLHQVRYPRGQTIFPAGRVCRELVMLTSGLVRVFYVHDAREVNLRLLCAPGAATAFSSLITKTPSPETVAAMTDVTGLRARFRDFVEQQPGVLAERLGRALAEQHYLAMERRLHTLQHKSADERYEHFLAHMEPEIAEHTPGYHVASYLGVTPESLSRVRAQRRSS